MKPQGTAARGYGYAHQQERKRLAPLVEAGEITCWRCGRPIYPGSKWDLGHDDWDRTVYRGPEHANRCNRAAGARKRNTLRRIRSPKVKTSREW